MVHRINYGNTVIQFAIARAKSENTSHRSSSGFVGQRGIAVQGEPFCHKREDTEPRTMD
jgi:hypothetical protein